MKCVLFQTTRFQFIGALVLIAMESLKSVDVVVGIFHWGDEYAVLPEKGSFLKIANFLNPHFDVVVGMHQHVISGHFYFKGTLFVLGLGNFLFPMH
ncbi:PGA biosynthesis protein CapA isoform X2 [Hydra vulgaris]|uniref:PGA biosynthesis protein CapA isoform X2 n=1 Tax=Hydra vulgaris TaxID=6087 RepID=A0ABM4BFR0_HYDVU